MSTLKIYSASAGSGKTYTLAGEFISYLVNEPERYSSILAVTFTNKAMTEMKTRILENLYLLSAEDTLLNEKERKQKEGLIKYHSEKSGKSERDIQLACKKALIGYLNDFSKFNISTIDSFFQKVIRSFAYEAGLPASFNIEVDQQYILRKAIDKLYENIENEQTDVKQGKSRDELKQWLLNYIKDKMGETGGWSIDSQLNNFGKEIFNEEMQSADYEFESSLTNKKELGNYLTELNSIISNYEKGMADIASEISNNLTRQEITEEHLNGKSRNILVTAFKKNDYFLDISNFNNIQKIIDIITNPESACHDKLKQQSKEELLSKLQLVMIPILEKLVEFILLNFRNYYTAIAVKNNFYQLGLSIDIRNEIASILREENLFLISDTNRLLNKIIDNNETPFIYEKTGVRYRNIMIDEFQDTSKLQWNNFRPLIENSLSQNDHCLVVGDVKQSIYRWRNSDWQLLNQKIFSDLKGYECNLQSLSTNWRSKPNIVNFNNNIFKSASVQLSDQMLKEIESAIDKPEDEKEFANQITLAYRDTVQEVPERPFNHNGYVRVELVKKEKKKNEDSDDEDNEKEDPILIKLDNAINQLIEHNFSYSDICILVRTNSDGTKIANYLLSAEKPKPVISNEALLLSNSVAVQLIIAYLTLVNSPDDKTILAQIKLQLAIFENQNNTDTKDIMTDFLNNWEAGNESINQILRLKGKPIFELAEAVISVLPEWLVKDQIVFINSFMENIRTFTINKTVNISDFLDWWIEKGLVTAISVPESQNAVRIMSVHKSKGLQFKAVLVPYANWGLDKKGNNTLIWSKCDKAPFNKIAQAPVFYNRTLSMSHLSGYYYNEMLLSYVDNLNILYVALTRAEDVLMVWADHAEKSKSSNSFSNISQLLTLITKELASTADTQLTDVAYNEEEGIFEAGTLPLLQRENATDDAEADNGYFRKNPFGQKLQIHRGSENMSHITGRERIWQGKLMHRIMEQIITAEDVRRVLQSFRFSGMITTSEEEELNNLINNKIAEHPQWFDGSHTIYAETSILTTSGNYRPDRVMTRGSRAVVVDYKFGQTHSDSYYEQVKRYRQLLQKMGFAQTEAYIWYFNEDNGIRDVGSEPQQGKLF